MKFPWSFFDKKKEKKMERTPLLKRPVSGPKYSPAKEEPWTREEDRLKSYTFPNGSKLYRGKDTGLIFYPRFPTKDMGTNNDFRPDFDFTHPDDWPQWIKNMHTEHAAVEVCKDGTVIWWGGTIHDGIWMPKGRSVWMGGCFRDGIWMSGEWYDGLWCGGEWRDGHFHNGVWRDGIFRKGTFEGLWKGGVWVDGEFNGYCRRTQNPPRAAILDVER